MAKKNSKHAHVKSNDPEKRQKKISPPCSNTSSTNTNPSPGTGNGGVKHYCNCNMSLKNSKRWINLKARLAIDNDDDLLSHLLDLAESIAGKNTTCNNGNKRKKGGGKDLKNLDNKIQNTFVEEQRRRSPRKFHNPTDTPQAPELPPEGSLNKNNALKQNVKVKKHKVKGKHHREKKKKRKEKDKNPEGNDDMELGSNQLFANNTEINELGHSEEFDNNLSDVDKQFYENTFPQKEMEFEHENDFNKSTEFRNYIKSDISAVVNDIEKDSFLLSTEFDPDVTNNLVDKYAESFKNLPNNTTETIFSHENSKNPLESNEDCRLENSNNPGVAKTNCNIGNQFSCYLIDNVLNDNRNNVDNQEKDQKINKKKRKRSKQESKDSNNVESNVKSESNENLLKNPKKKHKNLDIKPKKHHDVRKAPQNGIITVNSIDQKNCGEEISNSEEKPTFKDNIIPEQQRFAITIKLCQDCNKRHVQDACPLLTPKYTSNDSISFEKWVEEHNNYPEIIKSLKCEDPMSESYTKFVDDNEDSDDESNNANEDGKSTNNVKMEEKQMSVDINKHLYALDSLPNCLELKETDTEHGIGVYAKDEVPAYTKFGPLVGKVVKEMEIPDDFPMRHIWETENNGKIIYISTTNSLMSNWIRYLRPSETREDRNVSAINSNGELTFVTNTNIVAGSELTFWVDSLSPSWAKKNKTDKTNCGGCNLTFTHPIYYRLHCCIFHDTNYSLTIRKYHCKVCGAAVLGKDNIMKHAAELHNGRGAYQCQYCKKFFLRLNYLEMHRTYGCSQNPQRSRPLCDFCGRKFCQPQKLKVHIKRMHSDMSEVLREFQCKLCLKLLGSRAALQRHMKEVHHKAVLGAATCDRCGKMFQNKSNLKIHMLTHSGVKPFQCKENDCKAAFTTKQCLQFHYKKVHGLSEDHMPKIERSVAYTFDAYSGGINENSSGEPMDESPEKITRDNSNSSESIDECSSDKNNTEDMPIDEAEKPGEEITDPIRLESTVEENALETPESQQTTIPIPSLDSSIEEIQQDIAIYNDNRIPPKFNKKWLNEFNNTPSSDIITDQITTTVTTAAANDIYEFQEPRKMDDKLLSLPHTRLVMDDAKMGIGMFRRTESSNASLLVEAALDAAERDIGAVSSPMLEDSDRDTNLYSISNHLESSIPPRSPDNHLESYMQHHEDLLQSNQNSDGRHSPINHMHIDYHIHRPVDYINQRPTTHSIEQFLDHQDIRVSSPSNYINVPQEEIASSSPNSRYPEIHHHHPHHQVPTDNISSDEGDSVAQNLSLSVKEKSLQLDLSTQYKYDSLDSEFGRERSSFEPLIMNGGDLHGLDMSARGFHHNFGTQVQNTRYHHHLYEVPERQSVDLSRTGSYSALSPPPPPPPPFNHNDVLRVLSLDLTPGGRHSVDLSLARSHHLHSAAPRLISSPPPLNSSTSHVVPDTVESRILSPPPPPMSNYNPTYSVGPASYHPPRPSYHPYSGYY